MSRATLFSLVLVACGTPPPATKPTTPATPVKPIGAPVVVTPPATPVEKPLTPESIAARMEGRTITVAEVDRELRPDEKEAIDAEKDPAARARIEAAARFRAVNDNIDRKLLVDAADREFVVVTDAEVDEAIRDIKTSNSLDDAAFVDVLKAQGYTVDRYKDEIRAQLKILRMLNTKAKTAEDREKKRAALVTSLRAKTKVVVYLTEPATKPSTGPTTPPDPKAALLAPTDIANVLKRAVPTFSEGTLAGEPVTATYASRHFRADGKAESFDLAYRVWREASVSEARTRFTDLQTGLVEGTRKLDGFATLAFKAFSKTDKIYAVGFFDEKHAAVTLVTCGGDLCRTHEETLAITRLLFSRFDKLDAIFATK